MVELIITIVGSILINNHIIINIQTLIKHPMMATHIIIMIKDIKTTLIIIQQKSKKDHIIEEGGVQIIEEGGEEVIKVEVVIIIHTIKMI